MRRAFFFGSSDADTAVHHPENVPGVGFEPTRPFGQHLLRVPSLPFLHPGQARKDTGRSVLPARLALPAAPRQTYTFAPMNIERSLAEIGDRLTKARADLRIVEEQVLFQMDVVEETKTRMLVAETPIADREYRIARDDYDRMTRQREEVNREIAELQHEQDRLLDRMLGSAPASSSSSGPV